MYVLITFLSLSLSLSLSLLPPSSLQVVDQAVNNVGGRNLASENPSQNVNIPRFPRKRENLSARNKPDTADKANVYSDAPKPIQFMKDLKNRVLQQVKPSNSSQLFTLSTSHLTPTASKKKPSLVALSTVPPPPRSLTLLPLPPDLQDCNLTGKKDATSAISRAKTQECKDLIRNVTCLQGGGRLYDTDITNLCPVGRDPGKGFQRLPYSFGTGPNARIVFLMSVHGRAYRQVKRLFKAVYHTDHYFFIHVDSVSH